MQTTLRPVSWRESGGSSAVLAELKANRLRSRLDPRSLSFLIVFFCAAFLFLSSSAQAQSTSRFGAAGPTSGKIGFATATTGASFGVGSSAPPLSTSIFPGGQVAGEGRRTGGLGAALGTPGGMTQPHQDLSLDSTSKQAASPGRQKPPRTGRGQTPAESPT